LELRGILGAIKPERLLCAEETGGVGVWPAAATLIADSDELGGELALKAVGEVWSS
jgi:hypothetical protein